MLEDAERKPQGHIQFPSTRWSLVVNAFGFGEAAPDLSVSVDPGALLDGKYLIGDMMGEGGFGTVYRAEPIKRTVAIKVIRPGMDTSSRGCSSQATSAVASSYLSGANVPPITRTRKNPAAAPT
jgi:serine/threonine protein kinase